MAQSTAFLRLGTRGSPLALVQARAVAARLAAAHGVAADAIELVTIRTTGDVTPGSLKDEGGKGLFTKEIDEALLGGKIDLAVHSAKDMPTVLPPGIVIAACLEREDPRDVFIGRVAQSLEEMPRGARLGTTSPRRQAIALRMRPDLALVEMRGNVETRLRKLQDGEADGIILALAGLKRLGLADRASTVMSQDEFLPAAGQGAIAVAARADDGKTRALLAAIDHSDTSVALVAERAFLGVLDGSCRTPIAAHATVSGDALHFRGLIARPDGSEAHDITGNGARKDAEAIGAEAGRTLKQRAAPGYLD